MDAAASKVAFDKQTASTYFVSDSQYSKEHNFEIFVVIKLDIMFLQCCAY